MRRSHLPPEHWMLQVTCRQRAGLPASLEGICVSIEMVVAAKPWPMILRRRSCANYQSLVDCNSGGLPFLVGVRSSKKTRSRASSVTVSPAITSATNGGWGAV